MSVNFEKEAKLCLKAAVTANDLLLTSQLDRTQIQTKESMRDIVTEVDIRIQSEILKILSESSHPVLAEESGLDSASIPTEKPFWVVDPIDGTVNFVNGMPLYGTSIGLCRKTKNNVFEFLTGAVALPRLKEIYFTQGDVGAFFNKQSLSCSDAKYSESLIIGGFSGIKGNPEHRQKQYEFYGEINDSTRGCLRLGSAAVSICLIASNRAQAAYAINAQLWDAAGGLAIAQQAGCKVWTTQGTEPTRISYVVGAPSVVDEILDRGKAKGLFSFPSINPNISSRNSALS